MQKYLRKSHDISSETIYNDLHGFIINQKVHYTANKEFYLGFTFQYRGDNAPKNSPERREAYQEAITHYKLSIAQDSEYSSVYYNLGVCWLHLKEWDNAWKDLQIADGMGVHLPVAFHKDYPGGIDEFKEKTGIEIHHPFTVLLGY